MKKVERPRDGFKTLSEVSQSSAKTFEPLFPARLCDRDGNKLLNKEIVFQFSLSELISFYPPTKMRKPKANCFLGE